MKKLREPWTLTTRCDKEQAAAFGKQTLKNVAPALASSERINGAETGYLKGCGMNGPEANMTVLWNAAVNPITRGTSGREVFIYERDDDRELLRYGRNGAGRDVWVRGSPEHHRDAQACTVPSPIRASEPGVEGGGQVRPIRKTDPDHEDPEWDPLKIEVRHASSHKLGIRRTKTCKLWRALHAGNNRATARAWLILRPSGVSEISDCLLHFAGGIIRLVEHFEPW